jgi:enoyl-CoA hydratase/carnithine racemase
VEIDRSRGEVAVLTLNRPDRMNALSVRLVIELREAVQQIHRDRGIRVAVLRGAGRGFCAAGLRRAHRAGGHALRSRLHPRRQGLWTNVDAPSLRHAIELENRQQVLGTFTGNMVEAMHAFQEKRPPRWRPL